MSGRRDFGIIMLVAVFLLLAGAAFYLFGIRNSKPPAAAAPKLGPDDVASVGPKVITRTDVQFFIDEVYPRLTAGSLVSSTEALRMQLAQDEKFCREFLGQMFVREAIGQYAQAQGVYDTETFRKRYDAQVEMMAVAEMLHRMTDIHPTEEEMHRFFDADRKWFARDGEKKKVKFEEVRELVPVAMGRQQVFDYMEKLRGEIKSTPPNWDGPVVTTIDFGGEKKEVTLKDFEDEISKFPDTQQFEARTPEGRDKMLQSIVERHAVVHDARQKGMMKDPSVLKIADEVKPNVAAERLALDHLGTALDKKIDEKYEAVKTLPEYRNARYHVAHILIRMGDPMTDADKQKARARMDEIYTKLKGGEDFAKLAGAYSEDATSAPKGGDIGIRMHTQLVPEFTAAISQLKKGEMSGIIETAAGLHVAQALEDPQYSDSPDTVRALIRKEFMQEGFKAVEDQARTRFPIFVNDSAAFAACGFVPGRSAADGLSLEELAAQQQMPMPPADAPPAPPPAP